MTMGRREAADEVRGDGVDAIEHGEVGAADGRLDGLRAVRRVELEAQLLLDVSRAAPVLEVVLRRELPRREEAVQISIF